MDIRWMNVPGTNGWYQVSETGLVRSIGRFVEYKDGRRPRWFEGVEPLEPHITEHGYEVLTLHLPEGKRRVVQTQVLVLEAFVEPRPEDKPHARHLDGNPRNNNLSNLAWGTPVENRADMTAHGRDHYATRDACKWSHDYTENNTVDPELDESPNKRICRACNCAGSAMQRNGTNRKQEPELFKAVGDFYFEIIERGEALRGRLTPAVFAALRESVGDSTP